MQTVQHFLIYVKCCYVLTPPPLYVENDDYVEDDCIEDDCVENDDVEDDDVEDDKVRRKEEQGGGRGR